MSNNIESLTPEIVVGKMEHHNMFMQVSIRRDKVVVGIINNASTRGFEVSFSPKKAGEFAEMVLAAQRVAEGRG